ncbi:hypothetical protein ABK046_40500 [Streptomyces caeruleatus]
MLDLSAVLVGEPSRSARTRLMRRRTRVISSSDGMASPLAQSSALKAARRSRLRSRSAR